LMPVVMAFDRAAGAPIKVWFLPEMHPEGKIKLRDMNVQVRSGILSVRICVMNARDFGKLASSRNYLFMATVATAHACTLLSKVK
jgi:hypothetical protein